MVDQKHFAFSDCSSA